jgi:hypothetical protein
MANRLSVLESVKTPLGFFVLVVGAIEFGLLGLMRHVADADLQRVILFIFAAIMVLLILVVGAIAVGKPGVLAGKPYEVDILGHSIGTEIFYAFDPYISNLPEQERLEAYQSLLAQMESPADLANRPIRKKIADVIRERAGLGL